MNFLSIPLRIHWLIAAHLLLMAAPLCMPTFSNSAEHLPFMWLIASLPIGSVMTIAIWLGLGPQRLVARLILSLLTVAFAVSCQVAANLIELAQRKESYDWSSQMLEGTILYLAIVSVIAGLFAVSRRRWIIHCEGQSSTSDDKRRLSFSLMGLIALTTLVSVVITLSRATRNTFATPAAGEAWFALTFFALFVLCFVANAYIAVHAALRQGRVASSLALVILLSALLGIALSLAMQQDLVGIRMVLAGSVISVAPTVIVVVSLLVVRSWGVRLVRRPTGSPPATT